MIVIAFGKDAGRVYPIPALEAGVNDAAGAAPLDTGAAGPAHGTTALGTFRVAAPGRV